MKRDTKLRTSKYIHNREDFDYPFESIKELQQYYNLQEINIKLPGLPLLKPGNFPNNIKEWLWSYSGVNDEEPWILLCKLHNNNYCLYIAWCDYTGFEWRGGMKLYITKKLEDIINYAMTNYIYKIYIKKTIEYNKDYIATKVDPKKDLLNIGNDLF